MILRYEEKISRLAMRLTRNKDDAEEVTQDVFVTLYKKSESFEGKSAFSSWIYRVTANTALMKLRKNRQRPTTSMEDCSVAEKSNWVDTKIVQPDLGSSRNELKQFLENAMNKLPKEYYAVFVLRDVDGLSNNEVSEILAITVPAVKSRLHRARTILQKRLRELFVDYFGRTPSVEVENDIWEQAGVC